MSRANDLRTIRGGLGRDQRSKATADRFLPDDASLPDQERKDLRDLYAAPMPEGDYLLAFVRDKTQRNFDKDSFLIEMEVVEGDQSGRRLLFPVPRLPKRQRRPNFAYVRLFVACTGQRAPKDLWRRRPRNFMGGCRFRAHVQTVKRDSRGEQIPAQLQYSRVGSILERVEGTPPCLQRP